MAGTSPGWLAFWRANVSQSIKAAQDGSSRLSFVGPIVCVLLTSLGTSAVTTSKLLTAAGGAAGVLVWFAVLMCFVTPGRMWIAAQLEIEVMRAKRPHVVVDVVTTNEIKTAYLGVLGTQREHHYPVSQSIVRASNLTETPAKQVGATVPLGTSGFVLNLGPASFVTKENPVELTAKCSCGDGVTYPTQTRTLEWALCEARKRSVLNEAGDEATADSLFAAMGRNIGSNLVMHFEVTAVMIDGRAVSFPHTLTINPSGHMTIQAVAQSPVVSDSRASISATKSAIDQR
jgi:hypothetical protein